MRWISTAKAMALAVALGAVIVLPANAAPKKGPRSNAVSPVAANVVKLVCS